MAGPGTEALAGLFIEDATYQPAPFSDPWRGLGQIAEMWEAERDGPDEAFTMTSEVVAASDARAVVRVEVQYDPPHGQLYRDLWVAALRGRRPVCGVRGVAVLAAGRRGQHRRGRPAN